MTVKLHYKLFFAITLANLLLALSIYWLGSWIFNSSFRDYLDQTAVESLTPLVAQVAKEYSTQGDWRWVRDHRGSTWRRLMREYIQQPRRRSGGRRPPPPEDGIRRPPPDANPLAIRSNLLLRDAQRDLVIGLRNDVDKAHWIPIIVDSMLVGELGFVRRLELTSDLDQLFVNRLKNHLLWMMIGILVISALVSIPLSRLLVRPVERLRQAVRQLVSGDYQLSQTMPLAMDEIGSLMQDVNILASTLSKNLNARQQWIADISHELRTPIAILQGEIEAIQDGIRQLDQTAIDSLHQETSRLSRLINDLHELSLSDMGALSYDMTAVNIVELLQHVLAQHQAAFDKASIECEIQSSQADIIVFADEQRLQQLFSNLARNTGHYTQSPGELMVTITKQAKRVEIQWSDSAPGVSDAELSRLFERLYRVDSSRNRNTGGSGLGLAICQNIVEANQGEITAKHSASGGLSIVLKFPLVTFTDS